MKPDAGQPSRLSYLGWSGFRIDFPGCRPVAVDPPRKAPLPLDRELNILLTHGHPEHIAGTTRYLENPARSAAVTLLASQRICRFMQQRPHLPEDCFIPCRREQSQDIPGMRVDVFQWRHMPLLPPGFGAVLTHIGRLAAQPRLAWRIVRAGLRGPREGPMLGFRLVPSQGPRVLIYGEGLHRRTGEADARRTGEQCPAEVLLVAVEPEDTGILPGLVSAVGAPLAIPYEAHYLWRKGFGMPLVDLEALVREFNAQGIQTRTLLPGTAVTI